MNVKEETNRTGDQMTLFDLGLWCGKTSQVRSQQERPQEKTSELSSKKPQGLSTPTPLFLDLRTWNGQMWGSFWEIGSLSLGEYTTRSFGESPNVAVESRLSQILEVTPPPRYCLSEKACRGILNRAEKRGKVLPPLLEAALKARCHSVNVSGTNGGGGKGILIQNESVGTISTLSNLHKVVYDASRRHNYEEFGEVAGTVQAHFGTGGGNVPIVCEDNIESYDARGKGNGKVTPSLTGDHERRVSDYTALIVENKMQGFDAYNQTVTGDVSMTLSGAAQDPHHIATVFGISPYDSNAMKSPNPESGIYEADTARTLDLNGGSPACNQGGMMIVESYRQDKFDKYEPTDKSATIKSAGGTFGGGVKPLLYQETVGTLCEADAKGIGNQYVNNDKVIIQQVEP